MARSRIAVFWVAAFMAMCSQSALAQATPVQLAVGESRTLELPGNPSTGFNWVLNEEEGGDGGVVAVEVKGYVAVTPRDGERPRLGAPAPFIVVLKGIAPGRVSLTFDYAKAGTPAPGSARAFAVEVLGEAAAQPTDRIDAAQEDALDDPTSEKPAESKGDLFADPNDTEDGGGLDE